MSTDVLFAALVAVAGGLAGGLVGVGGGILFVPALTIFLGLSQVEGESTSLLMIVVVALVGAIRQNAYGNLNLRDALVIGVLSPLGVLIGVFVATDVFLFYVFFEAMLVPMYFLIGVWGGPRKLYAAIKFFLYTLAGSVLMLLGIIALYFYNTTGFLGYRGLGAAPDFSITKSDGGASVAPGGTASYTLTYANAGDQGATGVVLTETVPANTTFNAGASTAGWVCVPNNNAGSTCTLAVGTLAAGNA